MTAQELLARTEADDMSRLRWHLCRVFGVAPWSRLAQSLTDEACLALAAHLVLDRVGAPPSANPNFDPELFEKRKGDRS